ncbi:MAG TPA: hypothetical protein VGJ84_09665, partial [Polyangiaceae bacterium]
MADSPSKLTKLFGTDEPPSSFQKLVAGPLSAELEAGRLRYLKLAGVEVLRGIAFLVRDENWGTCDARIFDIELGESPDEFRVRYTAACANRKQELRYSATIIGRADGSLRFEAEVEALTDFVTNRTGFVVLHPQSAAGSSVEVTHMDGRLETGFFPELIAPEQPFLDIRALCYRAAPGLELCCSIEGETFEMEDQRNWTDASFKTYVRPLSLPRPHVLSAGHRSRQAVSVSVTWQAAQGGALSENTRVSARLEGAEDFVRIGDVCGRVPRVGLGVLPEEVEEALEVATEIRQASFQMLVCRVDLRSELNGRACEQLKLLGEKTGAEIVLDVVLPPDKGPEEELGNLARWVRAGDLRLAAIQVFPAPFSQQGHQAEIRPQAPSLDEIYSAARGAFPGIPLGGGTFHYFTELNRKRPPTRELDFVTHTTCGVVHAADDRSVMETLDCLPGIIGSTRSFIGRTAYWIGPSAIGMRENPHGAAPAENPEYRRIAMARRDPRQRGLFGAAWYLGYLAHAARGGVDGVSLAAPTGDFGIVHRETLNSAQSFWRHRSVYPAYHALAAVAAGAGCPMLSATPADGQSVQAVAFESGDRRVVLLGNLTPVERTVRLEGCGGRGRASMCSMDESTFET